MRAFRYYFCSILLVLMGFSLNSCIGEFDMPNGNSNSSTNNESNNFLPIYVYPFGAESQGGTIEIIITTDGTDNLNDIQMEIPPLKYNKSLLFMLTQDDCLNSAFHKTWAAINGKPISYYTNSNGQKQNSYNIRQLLAGDLPPESDYSVAPLGTDDGLGKNVRFHFTTTLYPEGDFMSSEETINPYFTANYNRFMKANLIWDNVREILNYGNSISFHDIKTDTASKWIIDTILFHLPICQNIIKNELSNRVCKIMARPGDTRWDNGVLIAGNETYIQASLLFSDIHVMTKESNDYVEVYPFNINVEDMYKKSIYRSFYNGNTNDIKLALKAEASKPKEQRKAIHVGVHNTGQDMVEFLEWLNDNYGKDGDNSVWVPSLEEYYEYNYCRIHSNITKTIIDNNTVKFTVTLPSQQYFYYPSITLNLKGVSNSSIQSLNTNDVVTGLNYGDYDEGLMINIDCRRYLFEHATHYVEQYEKNKTKSNKDDALYFTNMLKDSPQKNALLLRLN